MTYVLITPVRNEEDFVELTLKSVVAQTQRPLRWVIVSDGSTDRTNEIVRQYAAQHEWIELIQLPPHGDRHFARKVHAFNAGYVRVKDLPFEVVGSLDADISFEPAYFEFLLGKFAENQKLGVAGSPFVEEGGEPYDFRFSSPNHVSGACQLFRRDCFQAIGGYTPVKGGGIDVIAVLSARMRGWDTRTFAEQTCVHHRPMGTAMHGSLRTRYKHGEKDYRLGWHPLWEMFRSVYQMTRPPYLVGGACVMAGYVWAMLRQVEKPVSKELIEYQRHDQIRRLRQLLIGRAVAPQDSIERNSDERGAAAAPVQRLATYVLVTSARNEAAFIEATIRSVVAQTIRPARWVIVSDGSSDGTEEIVSRYATAHDWIELLRMPQHSDRSFASKAHAFNAGWARLKELQYDYVGNIDADISFGEDHFAFLLDKLAANPRLGLAGTIFREFNVSYNYRIVGLEHVSGQCQLFRRECLEAIGGYSPVEGGGIDLIAVTTAQMMGWQTRTFVDRCFEHHRAMGSAKISIPHAKFRDGVKDYNTGGHPVWELGRAVYQMSKKPILIGGCTLLAGYIWYALRGAPRPVSAEFVKFRRRSQMRRLRGLITGMTDISLPPQNRNFSSGNTRLSPPLGNQRPAGETVGPSHAGSQAH